IPPTYLRCEYKVLPTAVDSSSPRLSWILNSPQRGDRQTAYEILAASSPRLLAANKGDLWDTGKVLSDETSQVAYAGHPLGSAQECFWKVRWWNGKGQPSAYSGPAWWKMGLLQPTDWKAKWIGRETLPAVTSPTGALFAGASWVWYPEGNPVVGVPVENRYFRRHLDLPAGRKVTSANFSLTADDQFTLWVNGKEAARSDGQTDAWRRPVTADIAKYLMDGGNTLAVEAKNTEAGAAGLLGRLVVEYEGGGRLLLNIDSQWKAGQTAGDGWQGAAFNDAAWVPAKETVAVGGGPWGNLGGGGGLILPPPPYLRKAFRINKPVRQAFIRATALGLYELHLNGQRVGDDVFTPGWTDYHKRVYYQTYDVTPMLRQGANALGVILADGWAVGHVGNGGRNRYGLVRPRLFAQMNVTYTDGTTDTVVTDGSWKSTYGPTEEADLLDGEMYDARKEMPLWDRPELNDSNWDPVDVYAAWPAQIGAYPGVPVRKARELKPKTEWTTPGAQVYDLGQNMVGWARIAVHGPAGTQIRLRFAEMLNPDRSVYTTNMRGARATDYYILKGGPQEVWEPHFTFHGFRYVELSGLPAATPLDPNSVTGVVVHSDIPPAGTFQCSSPMVNQLQSNIQWGQRGNFLEVPTDCPQRDERCGWMGDAQIFARTACYNRDVSAFFTKWMVDVDDARRGQAYSDVSPDVCCGAGTAAWADAGIIVPWTVYQSYGDKRIIQDHYEAMTGYIAWMEQHSHNLLRPAEGYGDWLSINAGTPTDVIATAYFAYSTSLVARMARVIGKEADAVRYEGLFGRIRDAFNAAYVTADGHIKGDTQAAYLMALRFNLLPEATQAATAQLLVDDIKAKGWHLSTGFVGVGYLNPTLTSVGHTDVAYRLLNQDTFPSWGFSIKHGATTIWERWDGWTPDKGFQDPGMNSFNHYSLGSVGEWLFRSVGGIDTDPLQPGYRHIIIHPEPGGGLTWAKATYDSIRGPIASAWNLTGGKFTFDVTIPVNTTATIYIPNPASSPVLESGKPIAAAEGLKLQGQQGQYTVLDAGSGTYHFSVAGDAAIAER
nr:glycoside hydrolase family 78 protein [Armatimonadota bacterium]